MENPLFFDLTAESPVVQHFGGMYCLHLQSQTLKQTNRKLDPKHGSTTISARYWKTPTRLHDFPSEKIIFFTVLFKFL
jgi:hypothetical protein